MKASAWLSMLGLLAAACADVPTVQPEDQAQLARHGKPALYPAHRVTEGRTLSEWNARWWEWLVSIPAADSPGRGGDCTQNQGDDVFFLASSFGDGPAVRTCTVPEDTPIFIPTVSSIVFGCPDVWGTDDCYWSIEENIVPYVQDLAESRASEFTYSVTIDGAPVSGLEDYLLDAEVVWLDYDGTEPSVLLREQDRYGEGLPPQDVDCARGFDEDNICLFDPGPKAAAAYGHAVILRPLDEGQHTLHVTGSLGTFAVDVTYTLNVVDD